MRTVFRWLGILLMLVVIAGAVIAYTRIQSPQPTTDGTLELDGLRAPVRIERDSLGVPHIYAETEHDLFFAQGYTHAQDRFWQMEFWRHTGMGELSEIVGPATLETDKFIRNMGWNRAAARTLAYYEANEPEMVAILDAYSAGVNAYLVAHSDDISLNQTILNLTGAEWEVEPWEPIHTVAWGIVMAHDLRGPGNMGAEQWKARMEASIGSELLAQVAPTYRDEWPVIVPPPYDDLPVGEVISAETAQQIDWKNLELVGTQPDAGFALGSGAFVGSNNWVVAGEHTVNGAPLLADDPHLGVQMPSIWYWMGLHAPGINVAGMGFAGVPGIVIGHNDQIAWGVTNMASDTQDVYIEEINPENSNQYRFNGEWLDMVQIEETIEINGESPVVLQVKETIHGPVLNTIDDELQDVLSVRWVALEPSRAFKAILMLNRASNYDEFREALSNWDTAGQNFVYADLEGNIAYQATGRYPNRPNWRGATPVPGTGEYEWDGMIPFESMPARFNPPEGFIVTANNAIVTDDYPYFLSQGWSAGDRAARIETLLVEAIEGGGVSAETYQAIHGDSYERLIDSYRPILANLSSDDPATQAALERVRGWDGQLRAESVPASIFEVLLWKLTERIAADELGDVADDILGAGTSSRTMLHNMADDMDAALWDDVTTDEVESAETIVLLAFEDAIAWLNENYGSDASKWTWGAMHHITFASNPLGQSGIAPVEAIVNRGPFPVDGGGGIVNANGFRWGENFGRVTSNPSMRMILDLSDWDKGQAIHPTGQSGHPYNPHYADMIDLWLATEYHDFWYSAEAVTSASVETLTLRPPSR